MTSKYNYASDFFKKPKYPVDIRFKEYIERKLNIPRSDEFAKACGDVWSIACKMDGNNLRKMSKDYVGSAILQISHAYGKLEPVNQFENFEEALKDNIVDGVGMALLDKTADNVIKMVKNGGKI